MWPILAILIFLILVALLFVLLQRKPRAAGDQFGIGYMDDGLWDLYVGLIFLLLGIAEWQEFSAVGIIPALLYPLLLAAKQGITMPRLGPTERALTRPDERRMGALMLLGLVILLGVVLLVFVLGDTSNGNMAQLVRFVPSAFWLLVIVALAGMGYRSGAHRLYLYAALGLAVWPVLYWLHLPLYLYAMLLGATICVVGLTMTTRFVQNHPKLAPS